VEQGHYGHRARKASWLYASGIELLPSLEWGKSYGKARLDAGYHSREERAGAITKIKGRLKPSENMATPEAFAELLIGMAETVAP